MTGATPGLDINPTQLEELECTLKPLADAHTLPPWCYTSEGFYAAEVREIFMKEWLGVGRVDEIPNPGDYLCADIAEEPIVVLRDKEGEIRGPDVHQDRANTPSAGWYPDQSDPSPNRWAPRHRALPRIPARH